MCIFLISDFCVTKIDIVLALFSMFGIIVVGTLLSRRSGTKDDGKIVQTIPPGDSDGDDDEIPTPKVGNKILFDTVGDMACNLVVTKVDDDEEEVHGFFVVELPLEAINIDPHYDSENDMVIVEYDLGVHRGVETHFDVTEPTDDDALAGYGWVVDGAEGKGKSA